MDMDELQGRDERGKYGSFLNASAVRSFHRQCHRAIGKGLWQDELGVHRKMKTVTHQHPIVSAFAIAAACAIAADVGLTYGLNGAGCSASNLRRSSSRFSSFLRLPSASRSCTGRLSALQLSARSVSEVGLICGANLRVEGARGESCSQQNDRCPGATRMGQAIACGVVGCNSDHSVRRAAQESSLVASKLELSHLCHRTLARDCAGRRICMQAFTSRDRRSALPPHSWHWGLMHNIIARR